MRNLLSLLIIAATVISCKQPVEKEIVEPPVLNIEKAIANLKPGDTLFLAEGVYYGTIKLQNINGLPEKPIVIKSLSEDSAHYATIDGTAAPAMNIVNSGVRAQNCSWLEFRNIKFQNCYTNVLDFFDCSYISVINCNIKGGKMAVYAKGEKCHNFLIDGCRWEQDPRIWTHADGFTWAEVHHGKYECFNGSIFQGKNIGGNVVIRNNYIKNIFNAFRLSPVADRKLTPGTSCNFEIYNNYIENSADNVLEPEVYVSNLYFYHNQMKNGHAFISITEVQGGPIYLFGNRGWSTPDCKDGWTIFKLSSNDDDQQGLDSNLYIFNNSWFVDYNAHGRDSSWKNNNIKQFNNAFYTENQKEFGIFTWRDSYYFDYDCSNIPFPEIVTKNNGEQHAIIADPRFVDGAHGDFTLRESSPCIDRGVNYDNLIRSFEGKAPDIGAFDNGKLIDGPAFKHTKSKFYEENSRIVKYKTEGKTLHCWVSTPLDLESVNPHDFKIIIDYKKYKVVATRLSEGNYKLSLDIRTEFPDEFTLLVKKLPLGNNNLPLTLWGSPLKVELQLN